MQYANLKAFIAGECANYFHTDYAYRPMPWCEHRQKKCVVLSGERCRYFEEAVLPAQVDMTGLYVGATSERREKGVAA